MKTDKGAPSHYSDLIGGAAKVGRVLHAIAERVKAGDGEPEAHLIYGAPGIGKTAIARIFALALAGDPMAIDDQSGLNVTIDVVRRWLTSLGTGCLFGDWQVRWIEELDRVPRDAQDLLLHYLDKLPPKTLFLGTSNLDLNSLQERFQTRLRTWRVEPPDTDELKAFLMARTGLAETVAAQIAVGSGSNVRAALLDAKNEIDARAAMAA